MEATQAATLTLTVGAVAATLYNRGVIQGFFGALRGSAPKPFAQAPAPGQAGTAPSGTLPLPSWVGGGTALPGGTGIIGAGNDQLAQAESAVTAGGAPGGGNDWLDWCLQWADQVRQKVGLSTFFGVATAGDACGSTRLTSGPAPRGSLVCVGSNHIGVSDGGCTYTSVGIYHGGPVSLNYCNDKNYRGYIP